MVREVRLSWDSQFPMPEELTMSDWDVDDSPFETPKKSKRKQRQPSQPASKELADNPEQS
ncbi:hypothetical protein KOR42_16740 [Thalassoglobus neptunius]|uniref:Uncharacterized protein n=1 Tax=Thalassoglobus neptunius TaxID=1938619 RepID=A0A5C5X5U0_9PLAN|nr:hypothetical protein [Thalassoglobus neptunius]TWT58300.1 hypothetical protein KOR42_16740 [Thalassoglobus neptunius]